MDDGTRFLSAVLEAPSDDVARLAYADWLDDHRPGDTALAMALRGENGRNMVSFALERGVPLESAGWQSRPYHARCAVISTLSWASDPGIAVPIQDMLQFQAEIEAGTSTRFRRAARIYVHTLAPLMDTTQISTTLLSRYGGVPHNGGLPALLAAFYLPPIEEDVRVSPGLAVWIGTRPETK